MWQFRKYLQTSPHKGQDKPWHTQFVTPGTTHGGGVVSQEHEAHMGTIP